MQHAEPLKVVFQDEHLLIFDKPSGLLVHRGYGRDDITMVDLVRTYGAYHPAHRLDRATSGLIVWGRGTDVLRNLQQQFEASTIQKTYLALVRGVLSEPTQVDHPVPNAEDGPRVDAQTNFLPLASVQTTPRAVTWVQANPLTGRFHQIRRHLKHISHPIIGDSNYGKGDLNRAFAAEHGLTRLALHASRLTLHHPITGEPLSFEVAVPEDLLGPLRHMGFEF